MGTTSMIEHGEFIRRNLMRMSEAEARDFISKMTPADLLALDAAFEIWAHAGQLPPPGEGWRTWLMMAGRGYGKTRAGAEWVNAMAMRGNYRFALVAASIDEARAVMVEGRSGLVVVNGLRGGRIKWEPSLKRLTWPSGSVAGLAWVDGAGDPDLAGRRFAVTIAIGAANWAGEAVGATSLIVDAASAAALGHGPATVTVSEIGAAAASRAALASAII